MKVKLGRNTITSDIAYIAGFFDGEGCIRLKNNSKGGNSYYVWVAITNTDYRTLMRIQDLFGGKIRQAERGVNKPVYHYLITSSEAVDMLKIISIFLAGKLREAELAITYHETKDKLTPEQRSSMAKNLSDMKREVIGNIYENPELVK